MSRLRRGCGLLMMGLFFLCGGLVAIFIFGQVYTLNCTRVEAQQINCTRHAQWLGLVSLGERDVAGLTGAYVSESCDEDGCTYRVELVTREGPVPLSGFYSSGYDAKNLLAQHINNLLADPETDTFEVESERSILAIAVPLAFILIGLGLALAVPISLLFPT